MPLPNFLVIGAAKAGTTSLYHYLSEHPEIYMSPVKEPGFFAFADVPSHELDEIERRRSGPRTIQGYTKLFDGAKSEKAIGEA